MVTTAVPAAAATVTTSTWDAFIHTMSLCVPPAFFMLVGSLAVFCQQPSHTFVSMMQHLGAGIVLSAVATELLPTMSAESSSGGWRFTAATLIGFFLGVAIMVGVAAVSGEQEPKEQGVESEEDEGGAGAVIGEGGGAAKGSPSTIRSVNSSVAAKSSSVNQVAPLRRSSSKSSSQQLFRRRSLMETYRQQAASADANGYSSSPGKKAGDIYRRGGSSRSSYEGGGGGERSDPTPVGKAPAPVKKDRAALSPPPINTSLAAAPARNKKNAAAIAGTPQLTESSALLGWASSTGDYTSLENPSPGHATSGYYDYHDEEYYSPHRRPQNLGLLDDEVEEDRHLRTSTSRRSVAKDEREDPDQEEDEEEEEETDEEAGGRKGRREGDEEEEEGRSCVDVSQDASRKALTAAYQQGLELLASGPPFAAVPWTLVMAVYVDSFMDGLLIGLSAVAGESAGLVMSVALTIEMTFLGLTFSAGVTKVRPVLRNSLVTGAPIMILLGGTVGALAAHALSANPILQVGLIAFGVAALLYLITEELLVEAHEEGGPHVWYVDMMFFVGFILSVLLEQAVSGNEHAADVIKH